VDISLSCYHTCAFNDENRNALQQKVPFKSLSTTPQWLGQGYYFWTDSDYYAREWGVKHYNSKYAINKFIVTVPRNLFFDLVGNVDHQLKFLNYESDYNVFLDKFLNAPGSSEKQRSRRKLITGMRKKGVTVSSLFWVLRQLREIDYKVVKAYDIPPSTRSIRFIDKECISLPTRQQIVVYPEAKEKMVTHISWVFPP